MLEEYCTVMNEASCEFVERKSRFIASVKSVNSEDIALEFIQKISTLHKSATHNVYGYIIKDGVEIQRFSDDGEPQGTAGIPVLEVLKRENLINTCVIVTRYFGGILLGAGGLIRAYSNAAKMGIEKAVICRMGIYDDISIRINYTSYGKIQNMLNNMGNTIISVGYTDLVSLMVKVKHNLLENTINAVNELSSGEALIEHNKTYYDVYDTR